MLRVCVLQRVLRVCLHFCNLLRNYHLLHISCLGHDSGQIVYLEYGFGYLCCCHLPLLWMPSVYRIQKQSNNIEQILIAIINRLLNTEGSIEKVQFILNIIKNQHNQKCRDPVCQCQKRDNSQQQQQRLQHFFIKNKIEQIILRSNNNFQLNLLCCYFMLDFFAAFPDLLNRLNILKKRHRANILEDLQYQCFKKQIKDFLDYRKITMIASETQKVQRQDQIIVELAHIMKQQSRLKQSFWSVLNRKSPDLKNLKQPLQKHLTIQFSLQMLLKQIFQDFRHSKIILDMLVLNQIWLKLKNFLSSNLKQSIKSCLNIKIEKNKLLKHSSLKLQQLMFQKSCTIFQSKIEQDNMGIIYNVSKNINEVFGYSRDVIIGLNINEIMPRSMQKEHDVILNSWRQRGSWANIHKIRFIFAMSKDHTCFSSAIYLRIVQREESINLLATFIKSNQNDYMLVNEQGLIDGVGLNLKRILGEEVVRIPFSFICQNQNDIINEVKLRNTKRISNFYLYHVKGLQNIIQNYHQSKYQISRRKQNDMMSSNIAKNRDRLVKITFSYQPYRMGSKFFVIFKFITDRNFQRIKNNRRLTKDIDRQHFQKTIKQCYNFNTQNFDQDDQLDNSIKDKEQQSDNLNFCQHNSSLQASNFDTIMSSQKIFTDLFQKIHKNANFPKGKILLYCLLLCAIFVMISSVLLFQQILNNRISQEYSKYMDQSIRFFQKFSGTFLALNKIQNIYQQGSNKDIQFAIQRMIIELNRVEVAIMLQDKQLWNAFEYQDDAKFNHFMMWQNQQNATEYILFDQYYSFYKEISKQIQLQHRMNTLELKNNNKLQMLIKNKVKLKEYIQNKINILNNKIHGILHSNILFSRTLAAILAFLFIASNAILYLTRQEEANQFQEILNILLYISEKNCQNCLIYYTRMSQFLKQCIASTSRTQNRARQIEKFLFESKNFTKQIDNKIEVEKDKISRRKSYINFTEILDKSIFYTVLVALILGAATIVKWNSEQKMHNQQQQFFDSLYQIIEVNCENVYTLGAIKEYMHKQENNQDLKEISQYIGQAVNEKEQKFDRAFLKFIDVVVSLDSQNQKQIRVFKQDFVCQLLKQNLLYYQLCNSNSSQFHFSRFKIFELHTLIEINMKQIENTIVKGQQFEEHQNILEVTEDGTTLQNAYIANLFKSLDAVIQNSSNSKLKYNLLLLCLFASSLFAVFIAIIYYFFRTSRNMNQNCGKLIIVPETILKNTKGAMKNIQALLSK